MRKSYLIKKILSGRREHGSFSARSPPLETFSPAGTSVLFATCAGYLS